MLFHKVAEVGSSYRLQIQLWTCIWIFRLVRSVFNGCILASSNPYWLHFLYIWNLVHMKVSQKGFECKSWTMNIQKKATKETYLLDLFFLLLRPDGVQSSCSSQASVEGKDHYILYRRLDIINNIRTMCRSHTKDVILVYKILPQWKDVAEVIAANYLNTSQHSTCPNLFSLLLSILNSFVDKLWG